MHDLNGKRILVVEDEALLALELKATLEDYGADVTGPCPTVADAMCAAAGPISAAILDVDLSGSVVFPVADSLADNGVPFVFHTGRNDLSNVLERYSAPICEKPSPSEVLLARLNEVLKADPEASDHQT